MIDLTAEELELVKRILETWVPGKKVVAFGSRVKGTAKPFSDLDLAIYSQSEIPVATMAFLRDAFESSMLPYKVDVVDVTSIDRTFLEII